MNIWIRAAISSILVSMIITMGSAYFTPRLIDYSPGISWDEVKDLKHADAVELINSRAKPIVGFAALSENIRNYSFWRVLLSNWLQLAAICFSSCALLIVFIRR